MSRWRRRPRATKASSRRIQLCGFRCRHFDSQCEADTAPVAVPFAFRSGVPGVP
jgi:hypothetical protein